MPMLEKRNSAINFLERTAESFSAREAIEDSEGSLTFGELREMSKKIGSYLLQAGLGGGNIAVMMPKNAKAIAAFFGVLYAGGTYVPLDKNDAAERLCAIAKNAEARAVITEEETEIFGDIKVVLFDEAAREEEDGGLIEEALLKVTDLSPAYIMHTSGSTGVPKGVVISHRGIIDFTEWAVKLFELDENSVIGLQSPFHFDASVFDIYAAAATGAKLAIMPDVLAGFPKKIPEFIEEKKVSCIFWVPGILVDIANSGALDEFKMESLKTVTFVGETMPTGKFNMWKKQNPKRTYINLYGPTEATVACTAFKIESDIPDDESIPIGKAGENRRIVILNEDGSEARTGETGEICILGSCLANGYYKNPGQTAFVQNPLNKKFREMMYKTGDFGYKDEAGNIYFSGRRDSQIKMHGIRVELGEIESAAQTVKGVKKACAVVGEDQKTALYIETEESFTAREFKLRFKEHAPKYMIPDKIIMAERLPLNKNGKIDRKKLKMGELT